MKGPHELLEKETERILSKLPRMQPGKHEGKIVQVPFSIPIIFRLDGNDEEEVTKLKEEKQILEKEKVELEASMSKKLQIQADENALKVTALTNGRPAKTPKRRASAKGSSKPPREH